MAANSLTQAWCSSKFSMPSPKCRDSFLQLGHRLAQVHKTVWRINVEKLRVFNNERRNNLWHARTRVWSTQKEPTWSPLGGAVACFSSRRKLQCCHRGIFLGWVSMASTFHKRYVSIILQYFYNFKCFHNINGSGNILLYGRVLIQYVLPLKLLQLNKRVSKTIAAWYVARIHVRKRSIDCEIFQFILHISLNSMLRVIESFGSVGVKN